MVGTDSIDRQRQRDETIKGQGSISRGGLEKVKPIVGAILGEFQKKNQFFPAKYF